jgi:Ras-related protein Rab-8A
MAKQYDTNIKLLLIGDSCVGKTCLMLQYAESTFSTTFITTVGIDYKYKFIDIDGRRVRLELWDTAGQERFKAITTSYLRGAQGILLVYDVTDRKSFEHVDHWMAQIKQYADLQVDLVLVGNKTDLASARVVSSAQGEQLAAAYGLPFRETSAKANDNVDAAFMALSAMVKRRIDAAAAGGGEGSVRLERARSSAGGDGPDDDGAQGKCC